MTDALLSSYLQLDLDWVKRHQWDAARRQQAGMPGCHKIWLMLEGSAEVILGDRTWRIEKNTAFLITMFPMRPAAMENQRRLVVTTAGANLFAMGFRAMAFHYLDLLQPLQEPVLWPPPREWERLVTCLRIPKIKSRPIEANAGGEAPPEKRRMRKKDIALETALQMHAQNGSGISALSNRVSSSDSHATAPAPA